MFFACGEIYSLFPSTCTDVYGAKRRFALHGEGLRRPLLVPLGNVLAAATGSWHSASVVAVNLVAALAAPFVLRPLRERHATYLATA